MRRKRKHEEDGQREALFSTTTTNRQGGKKTRHRASHPAYPQSASTGRWRGQSGRPQARASTCAGARYRPDLRLACVSRPGLPRTTTHLQSTRHWRSIYTAEAARPTHARRGPLARQLGAHDAAPRPRGEFALAGHKNKRRVGEDACVARALTCRASLSQKACRSLQHMQQRSCQFMAALRSRLALQLCCKRPQSVAVRPRRLGPLGPAAEPGSPGHAAPRLPRIPQRSCSGAPAQALATPSPVPLGPLLIPFCTA